MNDPNLKEALQKTQEQIETRVIDEPDPWGPLHKHVPKEWHGGFMFMGSVDHPHWGRVWYYKHGMTRKYLRIDQAGNFYREMEDPITKEFVLAQLADRNPAFDDVFKDIEKFGATRETSYDAGYKCRRDQALVEAGYTVASVSPEGVTEKRGKATTGNTPMKVRSYPGLPGGTGGDRQAGFGTKVKQHAQDKGL